jgi:hypothetical protein
MLFLIAPSFFGGWWRGGLENIIRVNDFINEVDHGFVCLNAICEKAAAVPTFDSFHLDEFGAVRALLEA